MTNALSIYIFLVEFLQRNSKAMPDPIHAGKADFPAGNPKNEKDRIA